MHSPLSPTRRSLRLRPALALALGLLLGALAPQLGCRSESGSEDGYDREKPGAPSLWGDAGEIQEILLEQDALLRAERLAAELSSLAPSALEDVLDAYDSVFLDIGDFELELLAEWWARFDPEAAWVWANEDWRARHPLVSQAVLRAWARQDPEAALREAEQIKLFSVRRPAVAAVLKGWQESGRPGAYEYVESLPAGHDRQRLLAYVAQRKVLRDGVEATLEWADAQPDKPQEFKLNLLRRVASAVAEVEPHRAAEWTETHLGTWRGDQLPQRVGTRWVRSDPDATMRWLSTLPVDRHTRTGVRETYRTWLRFDKPAARDWIANFEDRGPWIDEALALYAMGTYREDQGDALTAIEQAMGIHDEQLRWATVGRIWRVWYFREDEEAVAWFQEHESEIPEFYRKRIPTIPPGMLKATGAEPPEIGSEAGAATREATDEASGTSEAPEQG